MEKALLHAGPCACPTSFRPLCLRGTSALVCESRASRGEHAGLEGSGPVHCSESTVAGSDFGADDGRASGGAPGW